MIRAHIVKPAATSCCERSASTSPSNHFAKTGAERQRCPYLTDVELYRYHPHLQSLPSPLRGQTMTVSGAVLASWLAKTLPIFSAVHADPQPLVPILTRIREHATVEVKVTARGFRSRHRDRTWCLPATMIPVAVPELEGLGAYCRQMRLGQPSIGIPRHQLH